MKALWVDTYDEADGKYSSPRFTILVNISQIVYLKPEYNFYLLVLTNGSFYINEKDADKIKEAMIFIN